MKARPFILLLVYLCLSYPLLGGSTKQATTQSSSNSATVPALRYATYLGRTSADVGNSVVVGADGSLYVAGIAAPAAATGHNEAFVAHLSADGSTVLYVAYLGGNGDTEARALALDSVGNVYVTGETRALNFPVRNALQAHCSTDAARTCSGNAFLTKLNPDGTVAFSTYWGGSGEDGADAIALDASGNIYIAGATTSTNLPVFNAFQGTAGGGGDGFIAKFSADGSRVLYATYLGGRGADEIRGLALDAKGSIYVTGQTHSVDFPTQKGIQGFCRLDAQNACNGEAFVAKLAADGSSLIYSTYLGGSNGDAGNAIVIDASGSAYITGVTSSADFPLSQPLSSTFRGQSKVFLTKLSSSGSALVYSTYLGGSGADAGLGITLDPSGNVFVAGQTNSPDFPVLNAVQSACAKASNGICSGDAFVAVIDPTGSRLQFGSYMGGSRSDAAHGIAVDSRDSVYLAGATTSFDLPSAKPAQLSSSINGGQAAAAGLPASTMTAGAFAAKMSGLNIGSALGGPQQPPPPASNCSANSTNWLGGTGNWSNAGSWSTGIVPNSPSVNVCIDNGNAVNSQVTLDITATVGTLTIDSGDSLTISDNISLTVDGNISNSGVLSVSAAGNNTFLHIGGAVTLSGGGTLTMSNSAASGGAFINEAANGSILTNADNTIQGFGQIGNNGLGLVNHTGGIITANIAGKGLTINSGGVTNQGLLEAANGGTLALVSATYNNATGNITANGGGSTVTLVSANIQAGTLTSSGGGVLGVSGGNVATLDGSTAGGAVKIVGAYTIGDNSVTTIAGTINNTGSLLISAAGNNTILHVNGAVSLTGAGTVTMSNSGASGGAFINEASNGSILTNVNNTIQGFGQIGNNGLALVNQANGTIDANSTGNGLDLDPAGATNQGLLEATNGGILVLDGTTFNNAGANITASGSGSIVEIVNAATIQAGNLNTALGGVLGVPLNGSATLDGSTVGGPVNNTGTFTMPNNSSTTIAGTINNTGSILISAGANNTILHINGGVSLTGAGTVTMSNTGGGGAFINEASNGSVLTNVNNVIQGFGQIGNNGLALVNQAAGVINANVAGKSLDLDPAGATNLGILEATNGGELILDSTTFINTGANIISNGAGSNVALVNAIIQAGTLTASGGGLLGVQAGNVATLDGSTAGGAVKIVGPYTISDNSVTTIAGTINNTGSILISSAGNNSFLRVNGLVTLTGAGAVIMSSSATMGGAFINEASNGSVLTNASNTIQGFGQIGNNGLVLINQATINANGALGQGLNLNPPTLTNAGLLEATGGGLLQLTNGTINNLAGTIQVSGAASAVQFANNVTIQGGTLSTLNSGVMGVSAGNSMTLDGAALGKLTIVGTFTIADNSSITVAGTINNTGSILISSAGNNTFLHVNGPVTLTGAGAVTMSSSAAMGSAFINEASNGSVLTNANNTIQGFGQIGNNGLVLINQATINANGALGQGLNLNPPTLTNAGLLEATGGGLLQLTNGTINNSAGTIQVSGATSAVQFANNVTIQAGTLATANNGVLGVSAGNSMTLDGSTLGKLTIVGTFTIADNSSITVAGTINNTGSILISSAGNNTFLHVNGLVTLMGAGAVTMSSSGAMGSAFINEASNGSVLTLAGSTIQGFGQIGNNGLVLVNQGTINANGTAGQGLNLNPPSLTNAGLLEATGGGILQLTNGTINNSAGTIQVSGATSAVQFAGNVTIQAGTLATVNGGVLGVTSGNSMTLDGSTAGGAVKIVGTYTIADNGSTTIAGTINNTGNILISSAGNNTILHVNGGVSLTGAGAVIMSNSGAGGGAFINEASNGSVLTNAGNTIQGFGQIGNNGLVLVNQGTINANSAAAKALNLNPPSLTNQGVLEATGGGILQLTNGTIANNGGTISVNGATSSIQFANGVAIQGGTLTTVNNGVLGSVAGTSVTLDGTANALAISAGSTYTVANNSTTNIQGTINNAGTVLLAGAANSTFLTVPAGAVATLTGAGTVNLSGNANNILNGATLNNSGNTIKSLGTFSVASFTQSGGLIQVPSGATANPGAFALNGGTAQVDGTLSVATGASVTATGVLIGAGAVTPSVTSSGTVQPGDPPAPGILTIDGGAGSYSQVAAGTYDVLLGGVIAGTQFTQLNLTGAASLAGTLNASLTGGFTPASGQSFNILKSTSLSGQFSATNLPALGNGLTWQVNYSATGVTLSVVNAAGAALGISKSHIGDFAQGQQGATYTVVVSNAQGSGPTSGTVTVTELAPSGLTFVSMAGTGWTCGAPNPANICTRGDALAGGASYPLITVTVNVMANATSPQMNMVNVSGGGSLPASTSDSTIITGGAPSPVLTIAKSHAGNFTQGQHSAQYTVTVSNGANAGPTSGTVTVTDTTLTALAQDIATSFSGTANPNGVWSYGQYVESTGAFTLLPGQNAAFPPCGLPYWSGTGYPDVIANNTGSTVVCGTVSVPTDTLWMHPANTVGTDSDVRWTAPAAGTFEITGSYSALDITSTLDSILVNGTSVFSTNICVPGTKTGGSNTCTTVNPLAPFSIVQTLAAGSTVDFIVNCCSGADQDFLFDSTGLTGAIDSNLSGLSLVSMSGTGWTCVANSCTRSDALAPGATYPPITVLVNVGSSAPSPQVNTVNLTGGGSAPASFSDSTVITAKPPVLSIAKSHLGNFTQGQQGATYSVVVSNGPNAGPTNGTITVMDTTPPGLTFVSMAGTGWTCQTNTCTRGDALNSGASYSPITVTVNVTASATSPQVNAVSLSGGGSIAANANDSTVITSTGTPALSILKTHVGNFMQGEQGAHYTVTVTNGANAGPTNNTVSVVDTTPGGLTFVSMSGTGWVCGVPNPANDCTRNDALAAGASYPPITVTVNVTASATSPQVNAATVTGGGSATANANDSTVVTPTGTPALSIAKSHSGDFAIGQLGAQYTVIVSNAANSGPTNNTVSVVDAIPDGLTLVSMSGTGWTCGVPNPANDCTRNDALAAGASYPAITVVVNVTAKSPTTVLNMASVSGGGSATANASDSTNLVAVPFTLAIVPPAGGSPGTPLPVSPGGQVAIGLLLTPIPGFSGTVTFQCTALNADGSSASKFITCAPAPSQVKLSPNGTQVAIVVNTFCQGDVPIYGPGPGGLGGGLALLLAAAMLGSITWAYRRRSRWALSFAVLLLIALGNAACSSVPSGPSGRTPVGSYTLIITASANGQSAQVQQQIQVTQ